TSTIMPGDMWLTEVLKGGEDGSYYCDEGRLSDEYLANYLAKRLPLVVAIPFTHRETGKPDIVRFGIDTSTSSDNRRHGWTVTGEAPNITVTPSINLVGIWHGWLKDGILSEA